MIGNRMRDARYRIPKNSQQKFLSCRRWRDLPPRHQGHKRNQSGNTPLCEGFHFFLVYIEVRVDILDVIEILKGIDQPE